jgi:hypothetical protein
MIGQQIRAYSEGVLLGKNWHEHSCVKSTIRSLIRRAAYKRAWPNYCQFCEGAGEYHWMENRAPWGECWMTSEYDICDECIGKGVCPRCGQDVPAQEGFEVWGEECPLTPCPHCGWNWGETEGDVLDAQSECYCWAYEWVPA